MKIRIIETRDFRGTFGLRHIGDIIETEDIELVKQFEAQGLVTRLSDVIEKEKTTVKYHKEVDEDV